ncbi:MAG: poly-beta-1,6 N-acetyl-D-glucosamine export porin PgaA, partial [Gammaproteobacteria bacterium]
MSRKQKLDRNRLFVSVWALLIGVLLISPVVAAPPDEAARLEQAKAVSQARAGEIDEALESIGTLREQYPEDLELLYDQTAILSWGAYEEEVLTNSKSLNPTTTPRYVLSAIAKSARNLRQFDLAAGWYLAALSAEPSSTDARIGLVLSLADGNYPAEARTELNKFSPARKQRSDVMLASAYVYQSERRFILAINEYDAVLAQEPNNPAALRGKALALESALLPRQALAMAARQPGLLTDKEVHRLEGDELAMELRNAIDTPDQKYPFFRINIVLNRFDRRLEREPEGTPLWSRLQFDRIVGLVAADRIRTAIEYYEALLAKDINPAAYTHLAAAQAYLDLRRPHDALAATEEAEQQRPKDIDAKLWKFYALVELERYGEAIDLADGLIQTLGTVEETEQPKDLQPDPNMMNARIVAALGRAYGNQLNDAQARLEAIVAEAPNNKEARLALANVYRWRGWHERAAAEYSQILGNHPDYLSARTNAGHNNVPLRKYPPVENTLQEIRPENPSRETVWNLNQTWIVHNMHELLVEANWGESTGDVFGTDQYDVNAWLFSPPIRANWRAYGRTFDSKADFDDGGGDSTRRRGAAGAEYRKDRWRATAEFNFDRDDFDDFGMASRVDYWASDIWRFGGTLELNSYATDLRADRAGIESHLLSADMTYRRDDLYRNDTTFGYQYYDDGNNKFELFNNTRRRLFTGYTWWMDGTVDLGLVTNSEEQTVYYAPEFGADALVGVDTYWRMYRRYDNMIQHRLYGQIGGHNQRGFDSDTIWTVGYQFAWDITKEFAFKLGWQRNRRLYDNDIEYQT